MLCGNIRFVRMSEKCVFLNSLIWGLLYLADSKGESSHFNLSEIAMTLTSHDVSQSLLVRLPLRTCS